MTVKVLERKTRFIFWLAKGFIVRHTPRFLIAASLVMILFLVTKFILPKIDFLKPTYTEAIIGQYKTDKMPDRVLKLQSHGITKIEKDGQVLPDLAQSWDIENNGKTFIFHIKTGILWNDGTQLNGQNLNVFFDKVKTTYQPETVKFELDDAFSPFPAVWENTNLRKPRMTITAFCLQLN
jgi:hypothetical protein